MEVPFDIRKQTPDEGEPPFSGMGDLKAQGRPSPLELIFSARYRDGYCATIADEARRKRGERVPFRD